MKLTTKEVADKLGISPTRVVQIENEGVLPSLTKKKRGAQRRSALAFDSVEVEKYMAKKNGEEKPTLEKYTLPSLPPLPRKSNRGPNKGQTTLLREINEKLDKILRVITG